ncbi:CMD domain protein [Nocardiopsis sp. NPDC058789]|uniref:CMD domain protein n=1 Tax=Nocardiopsis sp. NPDC058789 TaxID=3346634 RepID=UPI003672D8E2
MADDLVDRLLGIAPGSVLDGVRATRPEARTNAQRSYESLLEPADPGGVPRATRFLVAAFVAGLHRAPLLTEHYTRLAADHAGEEGVRVVSALTERAATCGPYGRYRELGLVNESTDGPRYRTPEADRPVLGAATASALDHAHLLVFRPREAEPADLGRLVDAGWTTTDIVTLSQLVSFLAFQIRLVHGLEVLSQRTEDTRS